MTGEREELYRLSSYQFDLPPGLIAQHPSVPRDHSRLLVLDRKSGRMEDRRFYNILEYLRSGDGMVLNETRVLPARLLGYKSSGARAEVFLLGKSGEYWEALVRPARRLKTGSKIYFAPDRPEYVEILANTDDGGRWVAFRECRDEEGFIAEFGHIPLPPYIGREDASSDRTDYQTVYARRSGSVAAPTAGLHFTPELLEQIEQAGVEIIKLVLHVGVGTFKPVAANDIRQHHMHFEHYQVSPAAARRLNEVRSRGGRIVAVGTTVVRTLETVYCNEQGFTGGQGQTNLFIYPGYRFRSIDLLVSNFHLPGSSLLMLVSAFAGWEAVMKAYQHAVGEKYRFFSFGDAMMIY